METQNPLVKKIIEVLAPYLGDNMAWASIKMFTKEKKISLDEISSRHLPALAAKIEPGLRIFVGQVKAEALTSEIANLGKQ